MRVILVTAGMALVLLLLSGVLGWAALDGAKSLTLIVTSMGFVILVADALAVSLRDHVDFDALVAGWIDVVSETMQPRAIAVWTRDS